MKEKILSLDNFSQIVTDQNTVLIDFWATWCGPCKMLEPNLDELSKEFSITVEDSKSILIYNT